VSTVSIRPGVLRDVSYVFANMRDGDREEVRCQMPETTKTHEIAYWSLMNGDCWVAYWRDQPVMTFGVMRLNVAATSAWAIGTKQCWRAIPAVTRFFTLDVIPSLMERGYVSMEARSIEHHDQAHRWMEATGARRWGEPYPYGRGGEKFITFRWLPDVYNGQRARYQDTTQEITNG